MTPEEQAQQDAETERQLRDLAAQIAAMTKLSFDPTTIRKAIVVAVADTATPPTVSLNISGDSQALVTEVRTLNNFTPLVGQTVLIAKQGAEIFILGGIASISPKTASGQPAVMDNGWIKATLSNGSHGGGADDVYYRRVLDHGAWKMQWRGIWNNPTVNTMIGTSDALDPEFRPAKNRPISVARNYNSGAFFTVTMRLDFGDDGQVTLYNSRFGTASANVALGGSTGGADTAHHHQAPGHTSADGYSDYDTPDHGHGWSDNASHSHGISMDFPSWVSLNGVEYFL